MPPRGIFRGKQRPKGFEFASCAGCNQGTKAADAAVAFFARIDRAGEPFDEAFTKESLKYLLAAESGAPGLISEIFGDDKVQRTWVRGSSGLTTPAITTSSGAIAKALLDVFAGKLGMAIYHEHMGQPLPLEGGVQTLWFLNAGLSQKTAESMLSILPGLGTLQMGRKSVSGQFDYRWNSDEKGIVAALTHFHSNIHFFTLAMAELLPFNLPTGLASNNLMRPGGLVEHMPKHPPAILMTSRSDASGLILPDRFPPQ